MENIQTESAEWYYTGFVPYFVQVDKRPAAVIIGRVISIDTCVGFNNNAISIRSIQL